MEIRLHGLKKVRTRRGRRIYYYHRITGKRIDEEYGTAAFLARLEELEGRKAPASERPGTLGGLIVAYKQSPEYQGLARRTKQDYGKVFDYLAGVQDDAGIKLVDVSVKAFTGAGIIKLRDQANRKRKRRFATYVVQVLRLLFSWAMPRDWLKVNPANDVPAIRRPKNAPKVNRAWSAEELSVVMTEAKARRPQLVVPLSLGMYAFLREGDALVFPRAGYDGKSVRLTTSKNGQDLWLPAAKKLRAALDAALRQHAERDKAPLATTTMAINSRGRPWTESGFRSTFFKFIGELKTEKKVQPGLTFHGLRHTVGKLLAEEGIDARGIADVLGDKSEAMGRHYSEEANRKKRVVVAMRRLERKRGKVGKHDE